MNIINRLNSPTPKFFRVLRFIGLSLVGAGGTLLTAPVAIPATIITVAGYLTVAGSVMTAVSQAAVHNEEDPDEVGFNANDPNGGSAKQQ